VPRHASIALLVAACCLFGFAGAASTALAMGAFAYVALLGAGQALALGVVARRRRWPLNPFGDRRLVWFCASLLITLAAYFQALRWGPVGPVAAIHLSTPLLLLGWEALHGRRRLDARSLLAVACLLGGAALAGAARGGGSGEHPLAALGLAAFSAVTMAVHTWQLAHWGARVQIRAVALPKGILQAVVFAPLALADPPATPGAALVALLVLGALVTVPATLLSWTALAALPPTVGASVTLTEALFAGLWAAVAFGQPASALTALATLAIVLGVLIEVLHPAHARAAETPEALTAQAGA
jgi:drug/metabolite transporter (DMT)-like permease